MATRTETAVAASAGASLAMAFALDPGTAASLPTLCAFHLVTGLPCPGCGLGRSFVALAHGDFGGAFAFHPFGPLAFAACVAIVATLLLNQATGRRVVGAALVSALRLPSTALAAAWIAWAGLRLWTSMTGC